jgi:RNA ligase
MKFQIDREKYIDSGLVTERVHPTEPYLIYNYTPVCQYSKAWDEVTLICRGLIVHKDTGEIVARPFKKFFNYEEHVEKGEQMPDETPLVYDKRDGSLGILYWGDTSTSYAPYIATRGSFVSDQAQWATEWFRINARDILWDKKYTYLFEIIYPENRIVLDYNGRKGLDLLAIIDTETGISIAYHPIETNLGKPVKPIEYTSLTDLKSRNEKNAEGFVLHYPSTDMRVKIKFDDYIRLHKVITGLSEIGIWEQLREEKDAIEMMQEIPDEMHTWFKETVDKLLFEFTNIASSAREIKKEVDDLPTRKEQAEIVTKSAYPGVVFAMLDGKDYKDIIWKMVRPVGSRTFRVDIDK